jgi:Uma2 family endonuclease
MNFIHELPLGEQVSHKEFIIGELELWWDHHGGRYGRVWVFLERREADECITQTEWNIKGNK